ncbi:MAG: hypothetical protein OI74_04570 [Gammaproteobacteria bacterium (ex Lamellibrachia satsuma)]|nr:MAG: hypothetical protein OI74_04570 [Gammaproteobacteria bacterium (ex Lamellibrachia satsuma)]RRS35280.1 MAG: hypothetical protein NV67_11000 [Gammaproteobacteria bacterium (ex Lamellibrachia satsuma)]
MQGSPGGMSGHPVCDSDSPWGIWEQLTSDLGPGAAIAGQPVADAGSDRMLEKDQPIAAQVILQGAGTDSDGIPLSYYWYGPFPTSADQAPAVSIPEGRYAATLIVDNGNERSAPDTAEINVTPCFAMSVRPKPGQASLIWTHLDGTERYDVYRAHQSSPGSFIKIAETISTYSTYLDLGLTNGESYLYVVGALSQGNWCYSEVVATNPSARRSRRGEVPPNHAPLIYSAAITHGTVGVAFYYDVNAIDPDRDNLAYSLVSAPSGMAIDNATGRIGWTPQNPGSFPVELQVDDGKGLSVIQVFTVTVEDLPLLNSSPLFTSIPDLEAVVSVAYIYDAAASDPDNDPLTFALVQAPIGMGIDPVSGQVSWTPDISQIGNQAVTIQADDGRGGIAEQSFVIIVMAPSNRNPVFTSTPILAAAVGLAYTYDADASDPDADPLTFSVVHSPAGMSIDPATGQASWIPDGSQIGNQIVRIRVEDGQGGFAEQSFTIVVTPLPNQNPVFTSTPLLNAVAGESYTYDADASDPDADPLTYILVRTPAGMSLDPATGLMAWTPDVSQVGGHAVKVRVDDGQGGIDEQSFTLVVALPPNQSPAVTSTPPLNAVAGVEYLYDVEASDPEADPLTFALVQAPAGMSIVPATGVVNWTPDTSQAGNQSVTIQVDDGKGGIAEQVFSILVSPPNQPPVFISAPLLDAAVGVTYTYDVEASDPDLDALTFTLEQAPIGMSIAPQNGLIAWMPDLFQAGSQAVKVNVEDGRGGIAHQSFTLTVAPPPNQSPVITSAPVLDAIAVEFYAYDVDAGDPDGDPLIFAIDTAPAGMVIDPASGLLSWLPDAAQVGDHSVVVSVDDGRGGLVSQSFTLTVAPPLPVVLEGIRLTPAGARLTAIGTTIPLMVTADFSDRSTQDVTSPATGTTYESGNPFVATVGSDGRVTALANGATTITAHHIGFSDRAQVVVEVGVTLDSLDMLPAQVTLRTANDAAQLMVTGNFSDGSSRDLSAAASGTLYTSNPEGIVLVDEDGRLTPHINGSAIVTAVNEDRAVDSTVSVDISSGSGFLRGEVFDDSKGLPFPEARVSLVEDGRGLVVPPLEISVGERGQYTLPGMEGEALVQISADGFTSVERHGRVPSGTARTLLDARLTPLDARFNNISSAAGGVATDSATLFELTLPAGALAVDTELRLTPISNQGLLGRLPAGWSPISVIDVEPGGIPFLQPVVLTLPNPYNLPASSAVSAVMYDRGLHQWVALAPAQISTDAGRIKLALDATGQVALLLPDDAPHTPPASQPGQPLVGVNMLAVPDAAIAESDVVPPSAPPGEGARAVGHIAITPADALPSGAQVVGRVSETFDLLDGAQVVPQPFAQDLLLYAQPRGSQPLALATGFPITPSRDFTLRELQLGRVLIDVTTPGSDLGGAVVGTTGGGTGDGQGALVEIPVAALSADQVIELLPAEVGALSLTLPSGIELLNALALDLSGTILPETALLSIIRPAGVTESDSIVIAQRFTDPVGVPRLRIVALGEVQGTRIHTRIQVNGLTLPGITRSGDYLFLRSMDPLGLVAGSVFMPGGVNPQAQALVTSDSAPFADITGFGGGYVVAGVAATQTSVAAAELASGDAASAQVTVGSAATVTTLDITLNLVAPSVVSTDPAGGALDVLLNQPIVVNFSEPIDETTLTDTSVVLTLDDGTPVAVSRVVSADGSSLSIIAAGGLSSATVYVLTLTDAVADLGGNALLPFAPVGFTAIDTSKPPQPEAGQIFATLPDEEGIVQIIATQGSAEAGSGVTITNLASQETFSTLAQDDGSFRLRIGAAIGDELGLTFRNAAGQELTVRITEFEGEDGTVGFGDAGGSADDGQGRTASILPGALAEPTQLRIKHLADASGLPVLPFGFSYIDQFDLSLDGGRFKRLSSLVLEESQDRFAPVTVSSAPFAGSGSLIVPLDFLVNGTVKFNARAEDENGERHNLDTTTLIVGGAPNTNVIEQGFVSRFPTLYLEAPTEGLPNQQLSASAIAPAARVDLELPVPSTLAGTPDLLLMRLTELVGEQKLALVDRLEIVDVDGTPMLMTLGRDLPGATSSAIYVVVASDQPLVSVTGQNTGPAATIALDGTPFVFETEGPNAAFNLPVVSATAFILSFNDPVTGAVNGMASGQAPVIGSLDIGEPLGAVAGTLYVDARPGADALVDIGAALEFEFSEPIDTTTLSGNIVVTDDAGNRVFGRTSVADDATRVTFVPTRRWGFGRSYRYGISTRLLAVSGARLALPFGDEFTTFMPSVLDGNTLGVARDVAVSGDLALVGGDAGLSIVDISVANVPAVLHEIPVAGGVSGVALLEGANLIDRDGNPVAGTLGFAVSGEEAGLLQVFDLNIAGTPLMLGSTQLSTSAGQTPPTGVPDSPGIPAAVAVGPGQQALVAVQTIGVESVDTGQAIPDDPANPGGAIGPRFPASALETANGVAVLGDKLLVAGINGLTILDAASLALIGNASTTGNALGVAGVAGFEMDMNGDGTIDSNAETFDLAVVANGADGTIQFFDLRIPTNPILISAVRLNHPANSVALSREEGLAFVGGGTDGVALVDLSGPVSIQPIDLDFDTLDDRVLGQVSTPGSAGSVALDLVRGVGYVADGASGLTVVQLLPPRTAFTQVRRDPVAAITGEEQSILDSRLAFVTDDELEITISSVIPPRSGLYLAIEEVPGAGGTAVVTFPDGTTSAPLSSGSNILVARIGDLPSTGSLVSLKIQDQGGRLLDRFDLELSLPDSGDAELVSLFAAPEEVTIPADGQTAQISVGGRFSNGLSLNLTGSSSGTQYNALGTAVATVDTEGLVTAVAGGRTMVQVSNAGRGADVGIDVQQPPALTGIRLDQTSLTLVTPGDQVQLQVMGLMSDQSDADLTLDSGTQYNSDATNVVSVDSNGLISATGEGIGVVSVSNGAFTDSVRIAVEFRTPPDVAAIDLAPFAGPVRTDRGSVLMQAGISGTGSLEGLTVSFSILDSGLAPIVAVTDYSGVALAGIVESLGAGSYTVEASIIDPASGDVLIDVESLVVTAASGDIEPNDTLDSASIIDQDMPINGGLDGGTDTIDNFRMTSSTGGTLTLILELAEGTALNDVTVRLLSSDGSVLAVFTPDAEYSSFEFDISDGDSYLEVGNGAGLLDYSLRGSVEAGPLEVLSVSPAAGGTATLVTIAGSGFSTLPSANMVQFGGIMGEMISATSTQLQVLVPANATDGPVEVVVGSQRVSGPEFLTGNTGPPPTPTGSRLDPDSVRRDPVTGLEIVVNQLIARFRPIIEGAEVEDLALALDGQVVGYLPLSNTYLLEFSAIETIKGLHDLEQTLGADPRVLFASHNALGDSRGRLDTRDGVASHHSDAYRLAGIFEATERIRRTPPFDDPSNFGKVHIAFIDRGFSPIVLQEFDFAHTQVHELECPTAFTGPCTTELVQYSQDPSGHGTAMVSIVGMDNDNTEVNGILSGIYQPDPVEQQRNKNNNTFSIYASPATDFQAAQALLLIANDRGLMADVVVLGWGWDYDSPGMHQQRCISLFTPVLANMLDRTLVIVPAGNADRSDQYDCPGSLSVDPALGNVMTVGGMTVHPGNRGRRLPGSNYGPTITLAAPAEDILVVNTIWDPNPGLPYINRTGTSYAAAMVAGVAGMLQAIHDCSAAGADVCPDPPVPRFKPAELKKILLETAKDNSSSWDQGDMKRLNALGAVHEVLPRLDRQAIYVADQDAFNGPGEPLGRLIAMDVDPVTGEPGLSQVVPLKLDADSQTLTGARPTALETCGPFLFVVVEDSSGNLGDGVMQIFTPTLEPMAFYPFSGAKFPVPAAGNSQQKVKLMTNRPGMVCSKDRTLLYVGGTRGITIINVVQRKMVERLSDLPNSANITPAELTAFDERRVNLLQLFDVGIYAVDNNAIPPVSGYRRVTMVSCLELSPDGKTLFACLSTGRGKGSQPGAILPINVDLHKDANPEQGLQRDFSDYLSLSMNFQGWPSANPQDGVEKLMMLMKNPGSTAGGDEPSDVAVSADGNYLYLLNGGVFEYQGILDGKFPPEYYEALAGGQAIGAASSATSGGIDGLLQGLSKMVTEISGVYADLLHDLLEDLKKGKTLLSAPGYTGTFAAKTHQVTGGTYLQGDRVWFFPPEVLFGWNVSTSDNSLLLDQSYQPQVFAKRPFAMSTRPTPGPLDNPFSSSRALVAFHQTGNFGVLDLVRQREFQQAPPSGSVSEGIGAHPAFAQLPPGMFQGVVGVTPAIPLDAHLWPRRGLLPLQSSGPTFTSPLLPSPDEALLFTNDLVYAQSGRFAVASHAGFGSPITYEQVVVADFAEDEEDSVFVRGRLEDLGFTVSGTTATGAAGTLDEGVQFVPNGFADFRRGGGAITIIHDEPISDDFIEHFDTTVSEFSEGSDRAYFSVIPVCKKVLGGTSGPTSPGCEEEVTTRVYDYRTPDSTEKKRFHRPRGIAIDQFVYLTWPRFGDHIVQDDDFALEWRDPRVMKASFYIYDLDDTDSNGIPQRISSETFNVTTDEKANRRLTRDLTSLVDSTLLEHLHRYRIKVLLLLDTPALGGQYLFTHVDVTYDEP